MILPLFMIAPLIFGTNLETLPIENVYELRLEIPQKREYLDIPLSEDLQDFIFETCEKYEVESELVFAMIWRESRFQADTVGDNGDSIGLMQIQPKWHTPRMEKVGAKDLFNPYDNVLVGIDLIAEKLRNYETVGEALTAYNAGDTGARNYYFSKGMKMNKYAEQVIEKAEEYKK